MELEQLPVERHYEGYKVQYQIKNVRIDCFSLKLIIDDIFDDLIMIIIITNAFV